MKTLILFYSYSGHTRALAKKLAKEKSADIIEIFDSVRPGKLKAYVLGSFAAMRGKAWPIESVKADISAYDHLILMSPIWAGFPTPAFNCVVNQLPPNKRVSVVVVSASGTSNYRTRLEGILSEMGCTLESFEDIKQ